MRAGRALVSRLLNCEDILLNFVAAAAIGEQHGGRGGEQQAALPPHAIWAQPGRRLDISILSKVGISRAGASHTSKQGGWCILGSIVGCRPLHFVAGI
jgi:hypothetical protein